jgi:hypothetical protein
MVKARRVTGSVTHQFDVTQLMHFHAEILVHHGLTQLHVQFVQMIRSGVRRQHSFVIVSSIRSATSNAQVRSVWYAEHSASAAGRTVATGQVQGHGTTEAVVALIGST